MQPLPANSPRLRNRRVEAWVGHATAPGRFAQDALGRFENLDDAMAWVAETYPDAEVVRYTYYSAQTGWRPQTLEIR